MLSTVSSVYIAPTPSQVLSICVESKTEEKGKAGEIETERRERKGEDRRIEREDKGKIIITRSPTIYKVHDII